MRPGLDGVAAPADPIPFQTRNLLPEQKGGRYLVPHLFQPRNLLPEQMEGGYLEVNRRPKLVDQTGLPNKQDSC